VENRAKTMIKFGASLLRFRMPEPKRSPIHSVQKPSVIGLQKRRVIRLQKPSVKWTACAAASYVIVSLLLLAPSYDEQDHRRTAFILRGGSAKVTLTGVTKPASGEARTTEVAIINRGIGQANSAMNEGEPAPRSAPNIIIIRGGRRESKPQ
jgi:hypothetical protein